MLRTEAAIAPNPYPSTCWMVQRLTSRSLASSRWLTPFDRSTLMYSRCCSVRLGRRPGKRPSVRAFAWPATQRSLIEFRHHSLKANTIEIWSLPGYLIATDSSVANTPVNGGALQMEPPELSFAFLSTVPRQPYLPVHLLGLEALLGSVAVRPSYMCKSEPQIQEEVILTMPSLGYSSSGSGTFSAAILNGAW